MAGFSFTHIHSKLLSHPDDESPLVRLDFVDVEEIGSDLKRITGSQCLSFIERNYSAVERGSA